MISNSTYIDIINRFQNKQVLVIGDLILDMYLKGTSTRISPEAPVPVVDIAETTCLPGGAANTACNLKTLGAQVTYCTVVGDDHYGAEAIALLENTGIDTGTVLRHPQRSTLVKTRVISGSHLITRFDHGTQTPVDNDTCGQLATYIENHYQHFDAVIISDYDKGVITPALVDALKRAQLRAPKFLAVDSKRLPAFAPLAPALVTPNYEEATKLLDTEILFGGRSEQMAGESQRLFKKTCARLVAVTLDRDGSLFIKNGEVVHRAYAPYIALPQVAGAGDTFLSALTLACCAGGPLELSAEIATAAASIAIAKEATSSCSAAELKCYLYGQAKRIDTLEDLHQVCETYRAQGKRIVFTNGCFDILHSGHVTYLHCAKELGDVLIVGINKDESIRRIKGENRPINSLSDRIEVLSGLSSIDHIIPFGEAGDDTPIPVIKIVQPHIFVKGGDYSIDSLPEAATVEENGGRISFIPHIPAHSTSTIIRRIVSTSAHSLPVTTHG